jgi:hypothetical protein
MLKVICAWCQTVIAEKDGPDDESHTICPKCRAEHFPPPEEVCGC